MSSAAPEVVVAHPPGYDRERAHAAAVVLGRVLGLGHVTHAEAREDVALTVDGAPEPCLRVADVLFATPRDQWLTSAALPAAPVSWGAGADGGRLPHLYAAARPVADDVLGLDVFGSAFFLLTRYEEAVATARDGHGRFPAAATLAVRERFAHLPVVHGYAELLWRRMLERWPRLERRRRTPRLVPTHDVDWPAYPTRSLPAAARTLGGDLVRRRDPALAARRLGWEIAHRRGRLREDPYDTFDELMDISEAAGVRSAFYVLADGTYPLDDPRIARLLRRIHDRGHEIGLHAGYGSHRSSEAVAAQLATLSDACAALGIEQERWGGRQHYLQWENPDTWQAWEDAGLAYDATLGFATGAGFRTGACIEHPTFNLRTGRALRLRERPLVAMDGALLHGGPAQRRRAEQTLLELREQTRRVGGDFTLLWHNSSLLSRRDRELYRRLVR